MTNIYYQKSIVNSGLTKRNSWNWIFTSGRTCSKKKKGEALPKIGTKEVYQCLIWQEEGFYLRTPWPKLAFWASTTCVRDQRAGVLLRGPTQSSPTNEHISHSLFGGNKGGYTFTFGDSWNFWRFDILFLSDLGVFWISVSGIRWGFRGKRALTCYNMVPTISMPTAKLIATSSTWACMLQRQASAQSWS